MSARKPATDKTRQPSRESLADHIGSLPPDTRPFIDELLLHCHKRGAQLTPLRIDVLTLLQQHAGGLKAYDLLAEMQAKKPGIAPMSIYRTLDFLVEHELVHKIDATSTFLVCQHGHHDHHDHGFPVMLICEHCGQAAECEDTEVIDALTHTLHQFASRSGFSAASLEIKGRCDHCSPNGSASTNRSASRA
ncbi:MAG: Fur family transcriptional regulator [Lautropia sp.]|nr:Fur family transcriptional regulator [Lautropia sp.]